MSMKYCPECGAKLEGLKDIKARRSNKRSKLLTTAGILTIIAACMCVIIGIFGVVTYSEGKYREDIYYMEEGKEVYSYIGICGTPYLRSYRTLPSQYLIVGIFGFLSFLFGLTAGILILLRKLFCLTLIGQAIIMGTAILLVIADLAYFVLFGIPILIMLLISTVFYMRIKRRIYDVNGD